MTRLPRVSSFFRNLFHKAHVERDLDEEVRAYLDQVTDEKIQSGLSPQEARRTALVELGGLEQVKEQVREVRIGAFLETVVNDARLAFRMLRKERGFTAVAVLTLALGIGAMTAIFTVVNAVLVRPLPYPHSKELVYVQEMNPWGLSPFVWNKEFVAWRNQSRTLGPIAAYMVFMANLTEGGDAERVRCGMATISFFSMLGVRPLVGRLFLPEEDRAGGPPVVILSETLWRRRYGGDPFVVGKGLTLDGKAYTVVGVLPASFVIPDSIKLDYALWVPLAEGGAGMGPLRLAFFRAFGRLKSGASLATAQTELATISKSVMPAGLEQGIVLTRWQEQIVQSYRRPLLLFLGAVGLLLLIACVNVANLLLSRAATRRKEMAVRLTVGAGRKRVVRQLLTESALLALLGGTLGLAAARWGKDLLVAFISPNLPALEPITLDYRVLCFSLAMALVTGLAFGLVPALQASRVSLNEVLKEAGRGGSEARSGFLFRNLLVVSETALAMVLLVGAALIFRSFLQVLRIDPGFKSERILCVSIHLTPFKYSTPKDQERFFQQVIEGIKSLPGVQSAGGGMMSLLADRPDSLSGLALEGRSETIASGSSDVISPEYFRTLGIPVKLGRDFRDADRDGLPSVAIVNETFARRYFPNENCLGRRVSSWVHKGDWLTIVGIVGDTRHTVESDPDPEIFIPYLQDGPLLSSMTLLIRTAGDPRLWESAVRNRIASVDKDQPPYNIATMEELQAATRTPRRVNLLLLSAFAALGLILDLVGIYGVVSYSVSQRTHEIGVRTALGASRGTVLKLVVGQGLCLALMGTGIGVAASIGLTRFLKTMLFGVKPTDPMTFVAVSLILLIVAWFACFIPAQRATRVDPMVALRYE
jgi:putative ABC transport system permease protein